MYSYEINEKMIKSNYVLSAKDYLDICFYSPQISRVTYKSFGDIFEIATNDGWEWRFTLEELKEDCI